MARETKQPDKAARLPLLETDTTTGQTVCIIGLHFRWGLLRFLSEYLSERGPLAVAARLTHGETIKAGRFAYRYQRSNETSPSS